MVIPIEDNYIFSIPVIVLTINELNCNIHMQQSEIIESTNRNYGIYKPLEKHNLNPVNNSSRITVDIRYVK